MPHEIAAPRTTDNGGAHALHPDRGVVGSMGAIIGFREIKGLAALMASIIAPTIALGAATLAYHGSMAKVYRDCEEAERRRNSERLAFSCDSTRPCGASCLTHRDAFSPLKQRYHNLVAVLFWAARERAQKCEKPKIGELAEHAVDQFQRWNPSLRQ